VEKNNILLTTCAVGDFYTEKVIKFLETDFSKNFNVHILTDEPLLFKGYNAQKYNQQPFNYFDKFIFGINKIHENKSLGLLYDADELCNLERDFTSFDFDLNKIQFFQYWNEEGTLNSLPPEDDYFWEFFKDIIKQEEIKENDILLIHEDRMLFPKYDYSNFLRIFKEMKEPFTENSFDHHGHKGGVGNGEGVALGYSLFKTGLPFKVIYGSNT
tara:strand:+ start:4202 stop:4843 length:642 start_codon:yes stop_codon:yes gene_type:complete